MRILDRSKISYEYQTYECDNFTDGISTADTLGLPHERCIKPWSQPERAVPIMCLSSPLKQSWIWKKQPGSRRKSVEMLPVREITTVTGMYGAAVPRSVWKKHFDNHSGERPNAGLYLCQRRKAWNAAEAFSGWLKERDTGTICRCYFLTFRSTLGFFEIYDLQSYKYPV